MFVKLKGYALFQGEIITKVRKFIVEIYKSSKEPLEQFNQTWHKASLGKVDSNLLK